MGNLFRYYMLLTRRWIWLFVGCALVCSGAAYLIIPASVPAFPVQPRLLQNAGMGALVGLVFALLLSMFFERIGHRPANAEHVQKFLDAETLTLLPCVSRKASRPPLKSDREASENSQARCLVEEATAELPTLSMKLIPAPPPVNEEAEPCLPDTGESERINHAFSDLVILPGFSLSSLTVSGNGLIRRAFREDSVPSTPEPL